MDWTPQKTTFESCCEVLKHQRNFVRALPDATSATPATCAGVGSASSVQELLITHLSYDSRTVEPGTLFICKGAHFEPAYLLAAAKAGAVAYMSQEDYTGEFEDAGLQPLPCLVVEDIRTAIAAVAAHFYRGLLDRLTLIGFTGTKGKTTTTYLLRAILDAWLAAQGKPKSAWLSSIENYDGASCSRARLTTGETLELYESFVHAVQSNIEYLTMEVSSQALKYARTAQLHFTVAGFLNIGDDHISEVEHPTHEDYLASKLEIFKQCTTAVVNKNTDEVAHVLAAAAAAKRTLTFGIDGTADIVASALATTAQGLCFEVQTPTWCASFTLPMAGQFNVQNALAAIAAAYALDIPVSCMQEGLAGAEVSGRMQLLAAPQDKIVVIDYAHNKMSFETIFATVSKEYPGRPLVCVFGATGSKGLERRIDLPTVAVKYAHKIFVTEDDPGEEPLAQINEQIARVIEAAQKEYAIIEDRSEAIKQALIEAPEQSIVLVLGKGHETVMKRGRQSVSVPSDKQRVEQILATLNSG